MNSLRPRLLPLGIFATDKRIWNHFRQKETFPHRVNITPDVVLEGDQRICAYEIGPSLDYVKKWVPEQWELAFFGMLHIIPQRDFNLLEEEMRRLQGRSVQGQDAA